jgi:nucleoside-diphosphate-sugar epimerase
MKLLVTGDRGYIGSVLVETLLTKGYEVVGFDSGYFADNLVDKIGINYQKITKDIRDISVEDLQGVDGIIHLAGLSNDPLGEFSPKLTEDINYSGSIKLAQLAKNQGISRFVYASSQSMYGISDSQEELDEDNSKKNPVTAYAIAKWNAEQKLHEMTNDDFVVTSFRPSTVFGSSPRLRCDIVFNNLVACAYTTGKIEIMSDGSPWRPVVHIQDVCSAFISGIEAPAILVSGRAFNVGIPNGNFTVRDIAEAAQRTVPGCELIFTGEHTDPRSYKVSFNRILT